MESPSLPMFKRPADVACGTWVGVNMAVLGLDLKSLFQSK